MCDDQGLNCKGLPFPDIYNNEVKYPDSTITEPKIISVGKFLDGYYFVYIDKIDPQNVLINLFRKPDFVNDLYLKIYKAAVVYTVRTANIAHLNIVQKKANPTKDDFMLYVGLETNEFLYMDFPYERYANISVDYDMKKVSADIRTDFAKVDFIDFVYNEDGTPSKVGILGLKEIRPVSSF